MKYQVLKAVQPIRDEDVVIGQYDGYKDDPTVPKDSVTPTFAQLVLRINNERWDGTQVQLGWMLSIWANDVLTFVDFYLVFALGP